MRRTTPMPLYVGILLAMQAAPAISQEQTGSGVFTDSASETTLKGKFNVSALTNYQFLVPDFGTFTGAFMLTTLEYGGEYNGEVTYSFTFESSGAITFATV